MHSILQILTYVSEQISETTASMVIVPQHSLTIFYSPRAPTTVVPEMAKASWAAEKPGPAKWNVYSSGQSNKSLLLCYRAKKPQTSEALWGNSRGGLSKIFETGQRHNHTEPPLLFHYFFKQHLSHLIFHSYFKLMTSLYFILCFKSLS